MEIENFENSVFLEGFRLSECDKKNSENYEKIMDGCDGRQ